MDDSGRAVLDARIWADRGAGKVVVGERHRTRDGDVAVTWFVAPDEISGIFWIEEVDLESDPSAF